MDLTISCLCGAAKQAVRSQAAAGPPSKHMAADLCHCDTCRYTSGMPFTSYLAISEPKSLTALASHKTSGDERRYFCRTCGCHVFRSTTGQQEAWEVATGTIVESPEPRDEAGGVTSASSTDANTTKRQWRNLHSDSTLDGGLSVFLSTGPPSTSRQQQEGPPVASPAHTLSASCYCRRIRLTITRPDASSLQPRSNFPDLQLAYCSTPSSTIANPSDVKWWLRGADASSGSSSSPSLPPRKATKYLAGTCACRSCRLAAGFEIQGWAFIPRSNIHIHSSSGTETGDANDGVPLDFAALPDDTLQAYDSSPGVVREFCPGCGATVFWHDKWRPDLIDVSVGLLRAAEGSRAETWLDWWTGRVSFSEETRRDRCGWAADRATALAEALEEGLLRWRSVKQEG